MPYPKMPPYLKPPHRKRTDIVQWLSERRSYTSGYHDYCRFVWNVKLYSVNLSFDHLWDLMISGPGVEERIENHPAGKWACEQVYDRLEKEQYNFFFDLAVEDAWGDLQGDDELFQTVYPGEKVPGVKWEPFGRSSGYAGLVGFLHYDFTKCPYGETDNRDERWNEYFQEMPYRDLYLLHKFLHEMDYFLKEESVKSMVEYNAADYFACNLLESAWEVLLGERDRLTRVMSYGGF